jgi:hypothetical protein|tara:strand:- start:1258 stop:1647 length:390 start_codon:yes stop_codon:yes gene_type:complete
MVLLDALIGPVTGLLDKFIEDKDQKSALAHEIATMSQKYAQESALAQIEINKVEAASDSLFVSGWRPATGWVCVLGMTGNFLIIPFTNFLMALLDVPVVVPLIPLDTMLPVLLGMLGLGGLRTFEKTRK